MKNSERSVSQELQTQIAVLGGLVAIMWAIEIIDVLFFQRRLGFGGSLDIYGILPRNPIGLRGILFAPFLHGNFAHLIANTIPFLTLGWLVMLREISDFFWVSVIAAIVGGFGTWLIGSPGVHIGASGVIFGYLGYLLSRGYFDRKPLSVAISLFVGVVYGSMLWGVLPLQRWISWEGHLFGFIGGVIAAWFMSDENN
jgi:membrane associated rhomboid family serine protease